MSAGKEQRLQVEGQQAAAARNKLKSELAWVRRQPQGRQSKSKARIEAYEQVLFSLTHTPFFPYVTPHSSHIAARSVFLKKLAAREARRPKAASAVEIDATVSRLGQVSHCL